MQRKEKKKQKMKKKKEGEEKEEEEEKIELIRSELQHMRRINEETENNNNNNRPRYSSDYLTAGCEWSERLPFMCDTVRDVFLSYQPISQSNTLSHT